MQLGKLVTAAAGIAWALEPSVHASPRKTVSWERIKVAIARQVCIVHGSVTDDYRVALGYRSSCGLLPATKPLDRVAEGVLRDSGVLVGLMPDLLFDPGSLSSDSGPLVASTLLQDEYFLSVLLPLLSERTKEANLTCDGCPDLSTHTREISWDEFAPYIGVYAHPSDSGFRICGSFNSIDLPEMEPALLHAGLIAAQESLSVADRVFATLRGVDPDVPQSELEREIAKALASDPRVRDETCELLSPYVARLRLKLLFCDVTSFP